MPVLVDYATGEFGGRCGFYYIYVTLGLLQYNDFVMWKVTYMFIGRI